MRIVFVGPLVIGIVGREVIVGVEVNLGGGVVPWIVIIKIC